MPTHGFGNSSKANVKQMPHSPSERSRSPNRVNARQLTSRPARNRFRMVLLKARPHKPHTLGLLWREERMTRMRISRLRKYREKRPHRRHRSPQLSEQPTDAFPYERRESLLSRGEFAFYRALSQAVALRHGISMKTRLADIVRCRPELWDTIHGRRLSQKHVDFVVYDRFTAAIVAVVELDDRSHDAQDRRDRDTFVDGVLRSLDVAIVRVRAASSYDIGALRRQLDPNPPR
jgi:Protein of unknown function (DUF2726)